MDIYTIMLLGYQVSQKKTVNAGVYTIKFHRRKKNNTYMYIVELEIEGKVIERGIFSEYSNAVIYAGEIFSRFR
ncbi:hypothetical protein [Sulfurisphaera tokodaii]|uniref:Transposase n=2 Tax=Sulfurisphaera tokodaii TaxID=111955 RepID=F9VN34_SULTO|nr:hypothetical protein [Sulfurisphaera tokodaii]BAK54331.1 hypothetical protein STK_05675 [Sulfurisphaera tokodaii str. 7]HII74733.1 hypothetical protein [Sulfurisphaera tokodaii]